MRVTRSKNALSPGSESGMTLLEILLAMVMLAAVVAMVTMSISGSIRAIEQTEKQGEAYYRAQVALQRISEDLSSALLVEGVEFNGSSRENDGGRGNLLEFTSTAHVVFDRQSDHPGIAFISYSLEPEKESEDAFVLLRRDNLLRPSDTADTFLGDDIEALLLCDRLRSVQFAYVDENGDERDAWTSLSEEQGEEASRKLPVAVRVMLDIWLDEEREHSITFSTGILLPLGLVAAQQPEVE